MLLHQSQEPPATLLLTARDCSAVPRTSFCFHLIRRRAIHSALIPFAVWHKALITTACFSHSKTPLQMLNLCRCQAHGSCWCCKSSITSQQLNAYKYVSDEQERKAAFLLNPLKPTDLIQYEHWHLILPGPWRAVFSEFKILQTALAYSVQDTAVWLQQVQTKGYSGDQRNGELWDVKSCGSWESTTTLEKSI